MLLKQNNFQKELKNDFEKLEKKNKSRFVEFEKSHLDNKKSFDEQAKRVNKRFEKFNYRSK
ncbi:hypothetical protein [Enterococcus sp. AZ102]|uniref:hypothetical protein n=1 Tax=Enterococcus sp. AZ102 TaxID=2774865 RepID=UPI003F29DF04